MIFQIDLWTLVFFFYTVGLVALSGFVMHAVRVEDSDLWYRLGSPSVLDINATTNVYKFWKWVFISRSGNKPLSRKTMAFVFALRIGTAVYGIAFCAMAVRVFMSSQ